MKKRKGTGILIAVLVTAFLIAAGLGFYFYMQMTESRKVEQAAADELERNRQLVYVAKTAITKGEVLSAEADGNIEKQLIYSGLEPTSYMTEEQMGSVLTVDLAPGEPVMGNMLTTETLSADSRWYEINSANIMTTQAEGDCIDVRIAFPDGSDYIVLTKKFITDLKRDNCIFNAKLNEEEIIRMRSAIIDAYTVKGCMLYTVKYIESNLQEEAVPTYPVKEANIELINSDPNVLTRAEHTLNQAARANLDQRITNLGDEYVQGVEGGYSDSYSKQSGVWMEGQAAQTDTATEIDYGSSSDDGNLDTE